jgi:hypothetical protein
VTGDTTYGTVENIVAVEDAGIRAFFPLPDFDRRTPFFGKGTFTYDADADAYRCPQGQWLSRRKTKYSEEEVLYRADAAVCNASLVKAQCTASDHGRMVHRSFYEEYFDTVRGYHSTETYKKAIRKRQVWVEPLFAEAKEWHGLRRLRPRGLLNANIQGLLIAAGQNLKRLLAATGCGRRHAPLREPRDPPKEAGKALGRIWALICSIPNTADAAGRTAARAYEPPRKRPFFNGLGRYRNRFQNGLRAPEALWIRRWTDSGVIGVAVTATPRGGKASPFRGVVSPKRGQRVEKQPGWRSRDSSRSTYV